MFIQDEVSIAANSVNENILQGKFFEYCPGDDLLDYGFTAAATGLEVSVQHADRLVCQSMKPTVRAADPKAAQFPQDFPLRAQGVFGGERLVTRVRNTTGGAVVLQYTIKSA